MNRIKGILAQSGLFSNLVVLFAFICFFVLVLSPLTALLPETNPPSVSFMKLSQLILSTAVFILPPIALAYVCSMNPSVYLYLDQKTRIPDAGFVIMFIWERGTIILERLACTRISAISRYDLKLGKKWPMSLIS